VPRPDVAYVPGSQGTQSALTVLPVVPPVEVPANASNAGGAQESQAGARINHSQAERRVTDAPPVTGCAHLLGRPCKSRCSLRRWHRCSDQRCTGGSPLARYLPS